MEWLNNTLVHGPSIALCLSEVEFEEILGVIDQDNYEHEWLYKGVANATVHFFYPTGLGLVAIICLNNRINCDIEGIYGVLVHEATHIWQAYKKWINELNPSIEFEAYAMENMCRTLFRAYKQRKLGD